jgi:hypothetical protein
MVFVCLYCKQSNRKPAHNSSYKKLAVQWLHEALCFVSNSVLAESLVLQNRQLSLAANRYKQPIRDSQGQCKLRLKNQRTQPHILAHFHFPQPRKATTHKNVKEPKFTNAQPPH